MAITHNYLEVASKKPTAAETTKAELVINLADGTLWSETSAGSIIQIGNTEPNIVGDITITENATTVTVDTSNGTSDDIQGATATLAGVVTNTTQTFAGAKTFNDNVSVIGTMNSLNFKADNTRIAISADGSALSGSSNSSNSIAIGTDAGKYLTVGASHNTYIGNYAGVGNITDLVTGDYNLGIGVHSLNSITSGLYNTSIGYQAGMALTTGQDNIFIGRNSAQAGVVVGVKNIGLGTTSLQNLTSGDRNVVMGEAAGRYITDGLQNTFLGANSGIGNTTNKITGDFNVGLGSDTLTAITSGTNNICIGYEAGKDLTTESNQLRIGNIDAGITDAGLIEGDLSLETVDINGDLGVIGSVTGTSFHGSEPSQLLLTDDVADAAFTGMSIIHTGSGADVLTADRNHIGLRVDCNISASGGDTVNEYRAYGIYNSIDVEQDADLIYGSYTWARANLNLGTVSALYGNFVSVSADGQAGSTEITNAYGTYSVVFDDDVGYTKNTYGGWFRALKQLNATTATVASTGIFAEVQIDDGAGVIGTAYGVKTLIDNNVVTSAEAAITIAYLYHGQYDGTIPTGAWGVYINDNVPSYFGGDLTSNRRLMWEGGKHSLATNDGDNISFNFGMDGTTDKSTENGYATRWVGNQATGTWKFKVSTASLLIGDAATSFNTVMEIGTTSVELFDTPVAPTAALDTNTTQIATTAFVIANSPGSIKRVTLGTSTIVDIGTTTSLIDWDAQDFIDTDVYTHSTTVSNSELKVLEAGVYTITMNAAHNNTGASRATVYTQLKLNGVAINNSYDSQYSRGTIYSTNLSTDADVTLSLTANDVITVEAGVEDSDAVYVINRIPAQCSLTILRVSTEAVGNTWRDMDNTPANGNTSKSISSDWAYKVENETMTIDGVKTFSSSPLAPTKTLGDNTTAVATTAFVEQEVTSGGLGKIEDTGKNICSAWVKFNGVTVTIIDSFNVASIVKNSTGNYTLTFTTTMDNANYCGIAQANVMGSAYKNDAVLYPTTTTFDVNTRYNTGTYDSTAVAVQIYGGLN